VIPARLCFSVSLFPRRNFQRPLAPRARLCLVFKMARHKLCVPYAGILLQGRNWGEVGLCKAESRVGNKADTVTSFFILLFIS
jgi:hypothetical protein